MTSLPSTASQGRTRLRRRAAVVLSVAVGLVMLAGVLPAAVGTAFAPAPAGAQERSATVRTFGSQPLDEIVAAAQAYARPDCGLTANWLAAMLLGPVFSETGAPLGQAPGPMTLSRWDTQAALWAFGSKTTPYQRAFWAPGVGMWQFDSAGYWPLTAATAIDSRTSARQAAQVMSSRYCASTAPVVRDKMRFAWAPWYYCQTQTDPDKNKCIQVFRDHYSPNGLVNLTRDHSVGRLGGMTYNSCTVSGIGPVTCARVDPAKAQGYKGWSLPGFNPATPVTAPFYVFEHADQEYRYWLRQDTGYAQTVVARKPVRADARTSLTWSTHTTSGPTLCDATLGLGECAPPFGSLDEVSVEGGNVRVRGWAIDPDTSAPTDVQVLVDGAVAATVRADRSRPDVGAAHPAYGPAHGFEASVEVAEGNRTICVKALDTVAPIVGNTDLGCRTVSVLGNRPLGSINTVVLNGPRAVVKGWAAATTTTAPIQVSLRVDGTLHATQVASNPRPDLTGLPAGYGTNHGFEFIVDGLAPGTRRLCITAQATPGTGPELEVACRSVRHVAEGLLFVDVVETNPFHDPIVRLAGSGIIGGDADGRFRPTAPVSRQAASAFIHRANEAPGGLRSTGFSDVPSNHAFATDVAWLAREGIVTGYPGGRFHPTEAVSRQAFVAFLWRLAGSPAPATAPQFADVPVGHTFAAAIAWATENGVIGGYADGTFRPTAPVSRQAAAAMIDRAYPAG